MSISTSRQVPVVVHDLEPAGNTAQTPGMVRRPGIASATSGATKIWMGQVTGAPNDQGPPHHHAEAETAAYVLSGHVRVYYGEGFKKYVEAGPGDFLFVPSYMPHIEANPYDEPFEVVLCRTPDNIVINLE
jgi:uncharacterized RmlC-like cupin family protein